MGDRTQKHMRRNIGVKVPTYDQILLSLMKSQQTSKY